MRVRTLVLLSVLALLVVVSPLQSRVERNVGEVPSDSELDESTRAVLERVKRPASVNPDVWDEILKRYKIKLGRNAKVHFFGKVVDQNTTPLEGVKVSGFVRSFNQSYLENLAPGISDQKEQDWAVVTDKSGRFTVRGLQGLSLHVRKLEKDGYVAPAYDEYFRISEKHFMEGVHHPQEDKPVVFKMWARSLAGLGGDLVRKEITIGGKADGTEYRVDLAKGARVQNDKDPYDVSIKIQSASHDADGRGRYNWSFSLSATDGGFAPTDDPHPFEAPEGSYVSSVTAEYPRASGGWSRNAQRKFYVRSRDGSLHAVIDVTVYAYRDGKALVRINSVANANGSRNLLSLR